MLCETIWTRGSCPDRRHVETHAKPERLSRTVIYQSPWLNLYVDRVRFPDGSIVEQHHLLDFNRSAVAAVAETADGRVLFVRICRYATDGTSWELPAGYVEEGESITEAAEREVMEETGYRSTDGEHVYSYYPINGMANQVFHIVRCRAAGRGGAFDTREVLEVHAFSKEEIWDMVRDRAITDGLSLTAVLLCVK
jgi:ADP-ribose pyrophosphatase